MAAVASGRGGGESEGRARHHRLLPPCLAQRRAGSRRQGEDHRRLAPDLFVFSSAEVWPVIREYERSSTAILNGYVHPRVAGYLTALEERLKDRGVPARPDADEVERRPDERRRRQARLREHAFVGNGLRRHRRLVAGAAAGRRQDSDPRHRRHLGRLRAHHRAASRNSAPATDRRIPLYLPSVSVSSIGAAAVRRHVGRQGVLGSGRRRRLDAGTGLLRPRRHRGRP